MTYQDTLEKIHSYLRFGSRLGLERMEELLKRLGNPERNLRVVHVAGTNGKGSVSRYLYQVMEEAGFRTGLYTSPFLERFTERIVFHGGEILPEDLISCGTPVFHAADAMVADGLESPTEFEIVTALAFVYFQSCHADYVILEVGLGGTGDSTNVVRDPLVSVITSISFDHMAQLGNSLESIAGEKAGIIKQGCPVVCGADGVAEAVIRMRAEEKGAPFFSVSKLNIKQLILSSQGSMFSLVSENKDIRGMEKLEIGMLGRHQVENARCAYLVLWVLMERYGISISADCIRRGFLKARQNGRLELLQKEPMVLIDGAHNEAGAKALVDAVRVLFFPVLMRRKTRKILLVLGMLADKEVDKMLDLFLEIPGEIGTTEPDNPRKLPSSELAEKIQIKEPERKCMDLGDSTSAAKYIEEHKGEYDLVIEAGSLYLIGVLRGYYHGEKQE